MDKIQKIIFWILVCVLLIGVGGEVLYHSNSGFQNFVNQLFHIRKSNEIDYENDEYVKSLKTEIETLKGEIEKYKQEDKILNARIQELENRVTILEQKVAALEKQKEELNAQIDALVLEVEEVWELLFDYVENQDESEIDAIIQDKVIGLENNLEDLQKEYEETKKENTDRINDINDELKNLNEEKKNTGDLIINIQRDIEDNRTIINNLYEINKEYYVTYYNLIIKIENNTATDEEKSQYEQIKSQIDENNGKIQEKEAENAVFSERMQNYMTQLDVIEKRIVVLEEEVSMLENEIQEIENKINNTINELDKFRNYLDKNPNVHEHIPGEEIIENLIEATCTTEGSYSVCVYCTVDGELISQTNVTVKPSGHKKGKPEVVERIEPTCYVEGYILQETYCLNCEEILSSSKIVLEPSHTMGEKVIENETETTYDEVIYCTVCKYEFERITIEKEQVHEHILGEEIISNKIESTCTKEGSYTASIYCTECGELISQTIVSVEPIGHKESESQIVERIEPTCYKDGYYIEERYCIYCDEILYSEKFNIASGHMAGDKVIENLTDTTYDEVIYCSSCGAELERRTITKEDQPDNPNDIYYNSKEFGKVTISNYNTMTEDQQIMSKHVLSTINGSYSTENYRYFAETGFTYITGLWVLDKNTQTLYLGDHFYGYDDYTMFHCTGSRYPEYLGFVSLNDTYRLYLETGILEVMEEKDKSSTINYNGTYVYQGAALVGDTKTAYQDVVDKLPTLEGLEVDIGTLYFSSEVNDINGLWLLKDNVLYILTSSIMHVESTKYNLVSEDENYLYFKTDSGFDVSINKTTCKDEFNYYYNDVKLRDYINTHSHTYAGTQTAKYIIDNPDNAKYFVNSRNEKIIYEIDGDKTVGFWAYNEQGKYIYLIWYSGFSAELESSENNVYVFKTITSTFTYYADESRYERT